MGEARNPGECCSSGVRRQCHGRCRNSFRSRNGGSNPRFHPMGRRATVDEIAGPFVFLASPAAAYVTGAILAVDGGYSAQ